MAKDHHPKPHGTGAVQDDEKVVLYWGQRKFKKSIYSDPKTNVGSFRTGPLHSKFQLYSAIHAIQHPIKETVSFRTCLCKQNMANPQDDEMYQENDHSITKQVPPTAILENHDGENAVNSTPEHHEAMNKSIDQIPEQFFEDKDLSTAKNSQVKLLRWHYCLGHLSFTILRAMSAVGILPKRLSKVHPPKCAACIFGKSTQQP